MYLSFYGLREAPFAPTPDPKFLFQSPRHREALAQLIYGVRERKGFIVLTGEIGTGKTTLLRTLLERLDASTPVAYVHNSALNIEGLLEYILQDWGVKSEAQTHAQRLFELNEFLIDQHKQGDRKSTRLNSSHSQISYAVFCLKKKKKIKHKATTLSSKTT